jgi:leucine dehydrogenase
MNLFEHLEKHQYGEVHVKRDAATGLLAIVAIHDIRLGPSLGGCRFLPYAHEELALIDALRLARGMTYKAAITGLPLGGGKSVILRPAKAFDRTALFSAFGRFVNGLGGRYVTAEDSGTGVADMVVIRSQTQYVTGLPPEDGGGGDPSPFTALGVRRGIEACVRHLYGRDLSGVRVAIQGVGHVGYHLAKELHALGAKLTISDLDASRTNRVREELGATVVPNEQIFAQEVDVFAPSALGAVLDDATLPQLRAKIVAGAANNQLAEARHGDALHARGIVYAPDYAINAGGLVNVHAEHHGHTSGRGYDGKASREKVLAIHDTILEIVERSKATNVPSHRVADLIAEERLAALGSA